MDDTFAPASGNAGTHRVLALAVAVALCWGGTTVIGMAPAAAARVDAASRADTAHVDNPYVGAKAYVTPDWSAKAAAAPRGGAIANQPTGVWLDSIASITAPAGSGYTTGLRTHLDRALAQGATLAQFVIYDLPGRECARLAGNGDLGPTGVDRYRGEFIDPIAAIEGDAKYASIRIVNVIEPNALPSLVTNVSPRASATSECELAKAAGTYLEGIAYALGRLHVAGTNIYNYLDAAHHGWIGWDDNSGPTAVLMASVAKRATGGMATVDGVITNTANYSALTEPFLISDSETRTSKWVDWNPYVDEKTFAQAFRAKLVASGFDPAIGMLIDTSRNGWGGPNRPTAASTLSDINKRVDASRVDRRFHVDDWCNQSGAGIGERPKASPAVGIDAYVWMKAPGESDGASSLIPSGPANPRGLGFDQMCDPTYSGSGGGNRRTGALANAPVFGEWFPSQFQQLLSNAYPAL
jgi:cellulose 1,4-beta-cellobiosidase